MEQPHLTPAELRELRRQRYKNSAAAPAAAVREESVRPTYVEPVVHHPHAGLSAAATGEPVQQTDDQATEIHSTVASSTSDTSDLEGKVLAKIKAGETGECCVRLIPQGNEKETGRCLFHYTVITVSDESFSGTFPFDIHLPYRLVSQSQTLGGMYQRVILSQTHPGADAPQGDQRLAAGFTVDLIDQVLDINTARAFYKALADLMNKAVQCELKELRVEKSVDTAPRSTASSTRIPEPSDSASGNEAHTLSDANKTEPAKEKPSPPTDTDTRAAAASAPVTGQGPSKDASNERTQPSSSPRPTSRPVKRQPNATSQNTPQQPPSNAPSDVQIPNDSGVLKIKTSHLMISAAAILILTIGTGGWLLTQNKMPYASVPASATAQPQTQTPSAVTSANDPALTPPILEQKEDLWRPN